MNKAGVKTIVLRFTVEEHGVDGKLSDMKESEVVVDVGWCEDELLDVVRAAVSMSITNMDRLKDIVGLTMKAQQLEAEAEAKRKTK